MHALITGITGQDGSYLAEFLLDKGYQVYGLVRRASSPNTERIAHILDRVTLIQGDLLDQSSLIGAIQEAQPDEVYNLAAMSHVGTSFKQPVATMEITGLGCTRLLEALRYTDSRCKFYQASTSELFGNVAQCKTYQRGVNEGVLSELAPFQPRSPYAAAKLYAHWTTANYRDGYGMYACSGILFNHESPRRGLDFVTRKITDGIARIKYGLQDKIRLGNLNAYRDWGYAGDYVEAMWLMLQQYTPQDYVIATGETHSVGEFVARACEYAELRLPWHNYVDIDPVFMRPTDVDMLVGDASKARAELGWEPRVSFRELVAMMIESDIRRYHNEAKPATPAYPGGLNRAGGSLVP